MTKLTSKIQYKNFEVGEFIEIQLRSYNELIELIEKFPWNIQRDKIVIGLTNPSITIERRNNEFLKLSLFYNQKYILRYIDKTQNLFVKTFIQLNDAYDYIKNFFEQSKFCTKEFRRESTWFQNNIKHFITNDFKYVLTSKSIGQYLLLTSGIYFFLSITILISFLLKGLNPINLIGLIVLLLIMFLIGGGLHLIIFLNQYNYAKNKILIMSKGNDTFYFGKTDNPSKYNKTDILQYSIIRSRGRRNILGGFAIIEIEFKNGTILKIPNLLVDYFAMEQKLFEYPKIEINKLPIL